MGNHIKAYGVKKHNLKNIDVSIPKGKLTAITGVSGSGKSSFAFDVLYEEGKRKYLSITESQFSLETSNDFERIEGLSPTIGVEQRIIRQSNPLSTVGTKTKLINALASLFSVSGVTDPEYDDGKPLSVDMFQKNSPNGMCLHCLGTGEKKVFDEEKIFEDRNAKLNALLLGFLDRGKSQKKYRAFLEQNGLFPSQTLGELTDEQLQKLKYGDRKETFPGVMPLIMNASKYNLISSRQMEIITGEYGKKIICPRCHGVGLNQIASHTRLQDRTFAELSNMSLNELDKFLLNAEDDKNKKIVKAIRLRIQYLVMLGLGHLSMSRPIPTLSGGELQRLCISAFIMSDFDSLTFIFDEPSIGLHEREKEKLIEVLKNIVSAGNTVIVVEHDESIISVADYIVELGPGAGTEGGELIFQGEYKDFLNCEDSVTAKYLKDRKYFIENYKHQTKNAPASHHDERLRICGARIHNLKNLSLSIPLYKMVGFAGVSGSGKSSLIAHTLVPKLKMLIRNRIVQDEDEDIYDYPRELDDVQIQGTEYINKCYVINQQPIGRAKTSNIATYTGVFDVIRKLFAETEDAKDLGFDMSFFSLNAEGGCPTCGGQGFLVYHVGFGDMNMICDECHGTGYIEEVLDVKYHHKNIAEVLEMTVKEACGFFGDVPKIVQILRLLDKVGMGYIQLGQKTTTISGGEAQRIKLAKELGKSRNKDNIYILDEPTVGLSPKDSEHLIYLLREICNAGNTVIVTEHDIDVLSCCDYLFELGPKGGEEGGYLIAEGTPESLKENANSVIGGYLK
ncbi:MAG: excinuclease ABC subunit UvrA [Clostridia bacterium]|nr:excinuclease ABC subunit UvrA [Clostridia bacterium]